TYAVRLEHGGRSLVYGADCAENPALVELARGAHLLVTECTFGPTPVPPGVPHLNAAAAARMANAAAVERLVITHCSPEWEVQETLAAARRVARMPVHWARPHQEFPA
ncbi:MAG: MBL fold metallo-hydrolase, partial [Thermoleophilia bacterium]